MVKKAQIHRMKQGGACSTGPFKYSYIFIKPIGKSDLTSNLLTSSQRQHCLR